MRRIMTAIGLGLSAVLLTGGCQLVGGGNDAKSSKPAETSKGTSGGPQQAQAAPSPQSSALAPPVSKQITRPIPGQEGETYTLGYAGIKVTGQLAKLTLVWTPHGVPANATGTPDISISDMAGGIGDAYEVNLVDKANLKRYAVVKDSSGHDLHTDGITVQTGNNQPLTSTWWFAAPPPNGDLDVTLADRPVFESVQVTR